METGLSKSSLLSSIILKNYASANDYFDLEMNQLPEALLLFLEEWSLSITIVEGTSVL